jgi:hypothetical protein
MKKRNKIRINLEVTEETKECLTALQAKCNASTLTEVIRKAVAVLDFIVDRGGEFSVQANGQEQEKYKIF